MRNAFWTLVVLGTGFLVGCDGGGSSGSGEGAVPVVATTSIIADAIREVGGSHVEVTALMGPGTDPHTYLPSPSDARRLASARLVFFNGLHLEGKMTQLLEENRGGGARAVAVSSAIPADQLLSVHDGDTGQAHDPHVWFDVRLWARCVETIRDELIAVDPDHADDYRTRTSAYLERLTALDQEVRQKAARIPENRRVLVTSHDAFGYFARAYGFEVRGLQGVSTASAAGTRDVEELASFLGQRQIPAVFCETSVPSKGLEKVLDTVRSRYGREVRLVGGEAALYSDALGPPGSPGETYIGMVRHNIDSIVGALGS